MSVITQKQAKKAQKTDNKTAKNHRKSTQKRLIFFDEREICYKSKI